MPSTLNAPTDALADVLMDTRMLYEAVAELFAHHDTERAWAAVRAIDANPGDVVEAMIVCADWNAGRSPYAPRDFASAFPLWLALREVTGSAAGDAARAAYRRHYGIA